MKTIWAHTLVMNEEKYLWYAVKSVIDYVDKFLLWDTGSTDATPKIARELVRAYPTKIEFKSLDRVTPEGYTQVSQRMLEETEADWFLIVDGDEIWWENSIKKVVDTIRNDKDNLETLVVNTIYLVGDIYHFQEEAAGNYVIDGKKGHIAIRAVNTKIPGLHYEKPHGMRGLYDNKEVLIQERDSTKRLHINAPYLHFSYLPRSANRQGDLLVPKRKAKLKFEIGISFPKDFYYPEVFFRPKPIIVPSVWEKMDNKFLLKAAFETPPRRIKRRLFKSRVGY